MAEAADRLADRGAARAWVSAFARSPAVALVADAAGAILALSRPFAGLDPDGLEGAAVGSLAVSPREALVAAHREAATSGAAAKIEVSTDDGEAFDVAVSPIADGDARLVLLVAADVTPRVRAERRLRDSHALLVDTQGTAHLGTWEWYVDEPTATWSDELYRIYGLSPETYTPSYEAYLEFVHPDDRAHVAAATNRVFHEHLPYSHDERIVRRDGSMRYLHTWAHAIVDEDGKLRKLVGVCQDITERKVAELALAERAAELARSNERLTREIEEREKVEAALRQAHKLEAIGRLAGGIAHDFNNLLGVVVLHAARLQRSAPEGSPARASLDEITAVSLRAARLTQQLLAFSRDQAVQRRVLDLTLVVSNVASMLRPVLGEDVELDVRTGDGQPILVDADLGQLEQVLLNLAVNARDAMPKGGRLTIEVFVARPGDRRVTLPAELDATRAYAVLSVADTGVGMDEATLARMYDPFFTTKREGKGTGLGLSTVYGVARQSGGAVAAESKLGEGSRFLVFFPEAEGAPREAAAPPPVDRLFRGSGTALVVEDEEPFRRVMRRLLEDFGFDVLDAGDPLEGLRLACEHAGELRLLITDVVMPRMGGRELAEQVKRTHAGVAVLYVSGYAEDAVLRRGIIEGDAQVLRKPFTPADLSATLGALLKT